jgi:hypothetical protein
MAGCYQPALVALNAKRPLRRRALAEQNFHFIYRKDKSKMATHQAFVVTPLYPLVNLDVLIGATVQAAPMDDPLYKHETYIGTIDAVKINKWGTFVHFKTEALVGAKWIKLAKVIGFAHYAPAETAKATAA